jgi:hypothetical protein
MSTYTKFIHSKGALILNIRDYKLGIISNKKRNLTKGVTKELVQNVQISTFD